MQQVKEKDTPVAYWPLSYKGLKDPYEWKIFNPAIYATTNATNTGSFSKYVINTTY